MPTLRAWRAGIPTSTPFAAFPITSTAPLRERAASYGRSLNRVALEALERGLGLEREERRFHDLDHLSGTWVDDPGFDRVIEEMDAVDEELWS